jgi:hypothetical protein
MNGSNNIRLTPEQKVRLRLAIHRMKANFLAFPLLCVKAACHRRTRCSGNPAVCMDDIGPDVPDDVRKAVDKLLFGKFAGRPFDEVLAEGAREIKACLEWREKIKAPAATMASANRAKTHPSS